MSKIYFITYYNHNYIENTFNIRNYYQLKNINILSMHKQIVHIIYCTISLVKCILPTYGFI